MQRQYCLRIFSTTKQQRPLHIHLGELQQDLKRCAITGWIALDRSLKMKNSYCNSVPTLLVAAKSSIASQGLW